MRNLLIGLCFMFSMASCIKWELDRREITSFNKEIIGNEQIGFQYKPDLLQKDNDEYLLVGMTSDSSVLLSNVSDDGMLINEKRNFGSGEGHCIVRGEGGNSFLLASSKEDAYLFEMDKIEKIVNIDSLKIFADRKIGLIKEMRLFDILISNEGDFWLTGYLQQEFGDHRLLLLGLNEKRKLKWIKTFDEGQVGCSMTQLDDGFVAILSEKANSKYLTFVDQDGIFIWQRRIASNLDKVALNIISFGEVAVTSFNTNNELRIIGFDKLENRLIDLSVNNAEHLLPRYITLNRFGNFVLTTVNTDAIIDPRISLIEVNQSGDIVRQKHYLPNRDGDMTHHPLKVQQVNDFGYVIFGISTNVPDKPHYFMIKTDEEGELRNQ